MPDFGGNSGGGGKKFAGVQRSSSRPRRKLGLRMGQSQQCDVLYACSVHMYQCINES